VTASTHKYHWSVLRGDYWRAAIGTVFSAGGTALTLGHGWIVWVFLAATVLFVAFGIRTWARGRAEYQLTDEGIGRTKGVNIGRQQVHLPWASLTKMSMRFYSTRRDRSNGWMQLILSGGGQRISIDSTIDEFNQIADAAATTAVELDLEITPATFTNLEAAGVSMKRIEATVKSHAAGAIQKDGDTV
jgi:hypothetical protein